MGCAIVGWEYYSIGVNYFNEALRAVRCVHGYLCEVVANKHTKYLRNKGKKRLKYRSVFLSEIH